MFTSQRLEAGITDPCYDFQLNHPTGGAHMQKIDGIRPGLPAAISAGKDVLSAGPVGRDSEASEIPDTSSHLLRGDAPKKLINSRNNTTRRGQTPHFALIKHSFTCRIDIHTHFNVEVDTEMCQWQWQERQQRYRNACTHFEDALIKWNGPFLTFLE
ncbi:hypothetical protein Aduo_012504 [Ancylostoma duodenale]